MKDWLIIIGFALFLALFLALIPLGIWLQFMAPCKYVDWMPAKDIPSRCLTIEVRP